MIHRLAIILTILAAGMGPDQALSQPSLPQCSAEWNGIVACVERKLCRCGFMRGGTMTGAVDGYRWDCGVLRPSCDRPDAEYEGGSAVLVPNIIVEPHLREPYGHGRPRR